MNQTIPITATASQAAGGQPMSLRRSSIQAAVTGTPLIAFIS